MVLAMNDNRYKERGRPRAFDTDAALDSAMLVFRQKGYHATSIGDLGQAMQLTTGSIYKAFYRQAHAICKRLCSLSLNA
ncbi:Bacterial regulatory proteins, tetR family [Pantoea agglomerans]|uniref:Bacterial regulatory proteins, tetR family n=1 Tax=Enterobacter agglomerans TaxID=549 RepID=A0A379LTX0_ENTAG|nr:Bacterial regulatory proteins, tetR family [Pantoea agglomerans]